jgi:hypothetical protein
MFGPRRPQKACAHYRQTVPAGSDINRGEQQHPRHRLHLRRNPTRPRTATRAKDLHLEGRCQQHAWAIAARVPSRNSAQVDGLSGRSVASASCPPRTPALLMASVARLQGWSRQWTTRPGSGHRCYTSSAWTDEAPFFEPTPPLSMLTPLPSAPAHRRAAEGFFNWAREALSGKAD